MHGLFFDMRGKGGLKITLNNRLLCTKLSKSRTKLRVGQLVLSTAYV